MAELALKRKQYDLGTMVPFLLIHASVLLVLTVPFSWTMVALLVGSYYLRMFGVTGGYHRYFSHRSYKLNRFWQFCFAFLAQTSAQKGALWWAAHHRHHHKDSDGVTDIHSPVRRGFWWSHIGWVLSRRYEKTNYDAIKDFSRFPELVWLNEHYLVPPLSALALAVIFGGLPGLVWGAVIPTVLLWHGTFTVNSLAHVFGRRRYATEDTSRNSALIALWTMGEGWHNNHHYYQASARQGFFWWEIDPSYYVLKLGSYVGIVRDLKVPPKQVLVSNRISDGTFDIGMFKAHWNKASRFVHAASASVHERVAHGREHAGEALAHRREVLEHGLAAKKEALEEFVVDALESAEDLAKATRRGQRELGLADG